MKTPEKKLTYAQWLKHYAKGIEYLKRHPKVMEEIQRKALGKSVSDQG